MSQSKVLISIVIATFNAEHFITGVLDSLQNRITERTEVIIVDGLSTDNTVQAAQKYNWVSKMISEKDCGIYDAMNKGVKNANGKFVLFLGADDKLLIDIAELEGLLHDETAIYYGNVITMPLNKVYSGEFNLSKLINRNICHQSIIYPRSLLLQQPYNLKYKFMADYVLNMQLWSLKLPFNYIDKIIAQYNIEGASSVNVDHEFKKDAFTLVYKLFGFQGVILKCLNPIKKHLIFRKFKRKLWS